MDIFSINLPQDESNPEAFSVLEDTQFSLEIELTDSEGRTFISTEVTNIEPVDGITIVDGIDSSVISGTFSENFDQQTFKVLDYYSGLDGQGNKIYTGKIYSVYNSLEDVEADLDWDEIYEFIPDPSGVIQLNFSGVATLEKDDMGTITIEEENFYFHILIYQNYATNGTNLNNLIHRND